MSCDRFINITAFQTFLYLPLLSWEICRGYLFSFFFWSHGRNKLKEEPLQTPLTSVGSPEKFSSPPLRCARFMKFSWNFIYSWANFPISRAFYPSEKNLNKVLSWMMLFQENSSQNLSQWHLCLRRSLVFVVGQISFMDAKVIQSGCELLRFPRENTHTQLHTISRVREGVSRFFTPQQPFPLRSYQMTHLISSSNSASSMEMTFAKWY